MISSEVQRTLVKSPPELWTELSDPAALARHLGEFGEIRITRSEPEQIVEWESDRARGRVLLKPSGWGTKVTLTVTGEFSGEDRAPASEAPADPRLEPEQDTQAPVATATEVDGPGPEMSMPAEPEVAPGSPVGVTAEAPAAPAPEALAAEGDATPETPPSPASEGPITEAQLDLEPDAPAELQREEAPLPTVPSQPAPRRGFFARLFGRGAAAEPAPMDDTTTPLGAPATFAGAEPEPGAREPVDLVESATTPEPVGLTESATTPQPVGLAESATTPEPIGLMERTEAAEPDDRLERNEAGEAADTFEATGAAFGLFEATEPPAADEAVEVPEPSPPSAEERSTGALGSLAAELQTAEEAAVVQVDLVLTSALDRLGSAHHRPFSRS